MKAVMTRILFELTVGSTSVLLNWDSAHRILADLRTQLETFEVIRLNAQCASTGSSIINNFPLSRSEARNLVLLLQDYVSD